MQKLVAEQTEREVLAAFLIYSQYHIYIDKLTVEDFEDPMNKVLFQEIYKMHQQGKTPDAATLTDRVPTLATHISKILIETNIAPNIEQHIQTLKEYTKRRRLFKLGSYIVSKVQSNADTNEVLAKTINAIERLDPTQARSYSMFELIEEGLNRIQQAEKNKNDRSMYPSLKKFGDQIAGFHHGELSLLGARPSVGKTAFAIQIATDISKNGRKVAYVNLEMSKEMLANRFFARETGLNMQKIRNGMLTEEDRKLLLAAADKLFELPITIYDDLYSIEDLYVEMANQKRKNDLDMVIVDYIQLLTGNQYRSDRRLQMEYIINMLQRMARELNIHVMGISALSREGDGRRPKMGDLKEASGLEYAADMVIFLHRPDEQPDIDKGLYHIEVIVDKQRNGPIGTTEVAYHVATQRFYDWEERR